MMTENIADKLTEALERREYPPEELASMVALFYRGLCEKGLDEAWARKLTEIYLSGL